MSDYINEGSVKLEVANGIGTIEFQHPASNSLPGKVLKKLADTITEAGENSEVKVIILKSAGDRAFCAGASFDELISIKDAESGKTFFMGFANVINALRKAPKFVIGRVQGKAVGGGVGLASSVDYCLATKFASVKLSELAIGIGPFVVGPAVERKVGKAAMTSLTIDATSWQTAGWAESKGMYANTFETVEELDAAVQKLAETLAKSNPEAMKELKKTFWADADNWDVLLEERAAYSGKLVLSDFTKNAIGAFKAAVKK
ncbi:enoyl-CoA hydratase/isomerase family protein [Cryomorpha ignava]|uniref:Enoyl-CoA hydratase/isomerase family protein n=1 Tax=Cryomorpha ignava TaxID=101383 RepID=A0A7K3WTF7_9FLAO|nr:enoyl-CoA hydratase/isomerase family protein [Cryomorpha ignava]NEN24774.1 enoyl-CoA hydratase/isomerase family protein [Cryomorpha ignava]